MRTVVGECCCESEEKVSGDPKSAKMGVTPAAVWWIAQPVMSIARNMAKSEVARLAVTVRFVIRGTG
jgi:hypothetical protein